MSYFEDYIEDGLCCAACGAYLDDGEPGYTRLCRSCARHAAKPIFHHKKAKKLPPRPKEKTK